MSVGYIVHSLLCLLTIHTDCLSVLVVMTFTIFCVHFDSLLSDPPPSVETAHSGHVNGLCYSSDGLYLLSFATDNKLKLWDAFYGKNTLVSTMDTISIVCVVVLLYSRTP